MPSPFEVDEEEWRDVKRNQQEQATLWQRLQFELESHLEEAGVVYQRVAQHLMDPKTGVVVEVDRIKRDVADIERKVTLNTMEVIKVVGIEDTQDALAARIRAIEDSREKEADARKATKQWGIREVLVPFLMGLLGAGVLWGLGRLN